MLDDTLQLGRPVKVDGDLIKTSVENNQCYTLQEITDIRKLSKSIKLVVKMKMCLFILWKKLSTLFAQPKSNLG